MLDGEKSIIERAVRGEASAFGLLYDYYQPRIYRFVLIKVGQREEAEDLTHQVFLGAWQNIKNYKSQGFPFSSWLYKIARNQVIDKYRRAKDKVSLEDLDPDYFVAPAVTQYNTEKLFELEKVRLAIQKLDVVYQDVIIMRFVEDLSLKETATALGKSEGAIKVTQHRALKKLKEMLV